MSEYIRKDGVYWSIGVVGYPVPNALIAQPQLEHEGWDVLDKTSPSGKTMFRCKTCGKESVTPDKRCPIGRTLDLTDYLYVFDGVPK